MPRHTDRIHLGRQNIEYAGAGGAMFAPVGSLGIRRFGFGDRPPLTCAGDKLRVQLLGPVEVVVGPAAGGDPISTRSSGYVLGCDVGLVDVDRFAEMVREATAVASTDQARESSVCAPPSACGVDRH